jgi:parvulin-like peptidyl-prolyl isomerase
MRNQICVVLALASLACSSNSKQADPVVVRVGTVAIRATEFQARMQKLAQMFRTQLSAASSESEQRRFLLDALLRDEATAQEARRRGYGRHPAVRNEMIARMLEEDVEVSRPVPELPDVDVERYYVDHTEELTRPKQVRVLQVFTFDRAVAERVAAQARAAERSDTGAFQDLVFKYSQDRLSRVYGGDLGFIGQSSTGYPVAVVHAAFALSNLYDVSDPVESKRGFHVLKLVQRLPAFTPTLSEAAPEIRARLRQLLVERKKFALASSLHQQATVEIDHVELVRLPLPSGLPSPETTTAEPHPLAPAGVLE